VQVIIAAAEEVRADLIVLGSRGMGGFPEQLLGSTSHQVAERSHLPVLIVPPLHRLVETD
jgi:nucleotide-binding universal stress UspA family protein